MAELALERWFDPDPDHAIGTSAGPSHLREQQEERPRHAIARVIFPVL
jgi:hypothetical protein